MQKMSVGKKYVEKRWKKVVAKEKRREKMTQKHDSQTSGWVSLDPNDVTSNICSTFNVVLYKKIVFLLLKIGFFS